MALTIEHLRLTQGEFFLNVPIVSVDPGEIVSVVGPSGSGKSTFLLGIAGFVPLKNGTVVSHQGIELHQLPPESRNLGFVFQKAALLPHMTVRENVELGMRARGVDRLVRQERALAALEIVQMKELSDRFPSQLSGGQAQRVMLARVFVLELPTLLLDEPFASLDPPLRRELRALLKREVGERRNAALMVTHDPRDVVELSKKVLVIENGMVVFWGTIDDGRQKCSWFKSFLA